MRRLSLSLLPGKKAFFASDFHLGAPDSARSLEREKKLVSWLNSISSECQYLFLVGDLFDFWFEYQHVVPKGHIRFLGKLAEMADNGVQIFLFTGNHDMWMFGYLEEQLGAQLFREPVRIDGGRSRRRTWARRPFIQISENDFPESCLPVALCFFTSCHRNGNCQ